MAGFRDRSPHEAAREHEADQERPVNKIPTQGECSQPMGTQRMNTREFLFRKSEALRRYANQLEALARAIPQDISHEADEALHRLLSNPAAFI